MGASVILLEGHKMGGDCLNYGCVPSKALIASGKAASCAGPRQRSYGVADVKPKVDYAAAKDHVADVIAQIEPHDSVERFEGLGVQVISEYGTFISPSGGAGGGICDHRAPDRDCDRFVAPCAADSRDWMGFPMKPMKRSFDLREKPEHLLIIGGGPIGMEMAQAHIRLGSKVTVIEGMKALGQG